MAFVRWLILCVLVKFIDKNEHEVNGGCSSTIMTGGKSAVRIYSERGGCIALRIGSLRVS